MMLYRYPAKLVGAVSTAVSFLIWANIFLDRFDFWHTMAIPYKCLCVPWALLVWGIISHFILGRYQKRSGGAYSRFKILLNPRDGRVSTQIKKDVYARLEEENGIVVLNQDGSVNDHALTKAVTVIVNYPYNNKEHHWDRFCFESIQHFVSGSWLALPNAAVLMFFAVQSDWLFIFAILLYMVHGVTLLRGKRILKSAEEWYAHKVFLLYITAKKQ